MTNQERVKETLNDITTMFDEMPIECVDAEHLIVANLSSISLCLKDISLSLAVIADKEKNHV